jgi:hypothetical protein
MPVSATATTTRSVQEVFDCAVTRLNALDFTLQQVDRQSGLIVAQKKTRRGPTIISGVRTADKITAAIFPDATTKQTTLRLTATTVFEEVTVTGAAGGRDENEPSEDLKAQAATILRACTAGSDGVAQ